MNSPKQPAKLAMLLLLVLLLLCNGVSKVNCSTVHENSVDLHALLDFKRGITKDPQGALSNWNTTTHFCRWNGVNCTTTRPFRVSSLNLISQNLQGQISSSVGNLTFLKALRLSNNSFVGTLPLLNHLQQLQHLSVKDNLLHGNFPEELTNCSNLASLDLSINHLTGVIPPRIGNLTMLHGLSLSRNNFTGFIPAALGTITTLALLDLSENQVSGQIPNELWQLSNMMMLALIKNSLTGGFPQILPNISSLKLLSLTSNMLGGALPSNIGDALPSLQFLDLGQNTFEGHIPASLGNVSGLSEIDLVSNYFTGKIPSSFGKLQLSTLNLEGNKLEARDRESWEFFDALANCSDLEVLSLSDNQLEGVIPNSIGNLSISLIRLLMGGNKLSGIVPPSIGKFHNLIQLSLDGNNLTGTIEEWVGKLTSLQRLNLGVNKFIGTIPPSIRNLKNLTLLSLAENEFTGSMPSSLGILQGMSNLNFSYNKLQGIIPMEFGNLKQLTALDLSSNKLSGQIPETLNNCEQLLTLRIDQNVLIGNIPTTFSNLNSLTLLNLSHNNLSGLLPDRGVNDLKLLTKLDLSYNHFQGQIPISGVFANATVVLLDGNLDLCGGTMELHMPPCHVVTPRTRTANYWVKILIPIFGVMSLILLVYLLLFVRKTSRRSDINLQPSFGENFVKVTYKDLAQATRDFSELNLIGRGSYGSVYRGKLKEKMEMAVKVFNLEMRGAERSFMAECEALRSIQHRNLLPIITACSTVDNVGSVFKALVYEFMPNGNLDMWIHQKGGKETTNRLGLIQRIRIAVNIADALDYLHHDCGRPTVHCDLKPSNILLDDDMNALLGDFGIARFYVNPEATWAGSTTSVGVKGTLGYIPPEYGRGGHASTSGDVYSFGIVLLEVFTSKRPTDPMFADGLDIIKFVENSFPDQIYHIIDAHLVEQYKNLAQEKTVDNEIYQCLLALLQVALCCTRPLPSERLNMKQVAGKMHAIKTSLLGWTDKEHSSLDV